MWKKIKKKFDALAIASLRSKQRAVEMEQEAISGH